MPTSKREIRMLNPESKARALWCCNLLKIIYFQTTTIFNRRHMQVHRNMIYVNFFLFPRTSSAC